MAKQKKQKKKTHMMLLPKDVKTTIKRNKIEHKIKILSINLQKKLNILFSMAIIDLIFTLQICFFFFLFVFETIQSNEQLVLGQTMKTHISSLPSSSLLLSSSSSLRWFSIVKQHKKIKSEQKRFRITKLFTKTYTHIHIHIHVYTL